MREARFKPSFADWQIAARDMLRAGVPPHEVFWTESDGSEPTLSLFEASESPATNGGDVRVPKKFVQTARNVALHGSPGRWALLYRVLWRLTHGEAKLLEVPTEADLIELQHMEKEVQKDAYRMRAFLRFRETKLNGETWFVAWYEPEHDVLALNEQFFVERFATMRWSILTPRNCLHWDGQEARYSPGVTKGHAPNNDQLEPLWVTYYSSVFNPARIKPAAMQAQLLKRNWKNLPEAVVIEPLLRNARQRAEGMIARSEFLRPRDEEYGTAQPPPGADLEALRVAANSCRACPLWKEATCVVFGKGPAKARVVLVAEQPGDNEDRTGEPFVGPAGQLLDRALAEAGLDRNDFYITGAVKHFKFEWRGKRRIHKTASPREIAACRPWLAAQLGEIQPELIVALGATAVRSLLGVSLKVTEERGRVHPSEFGPTLITLHPSALLRLPPGVGFEPEFARYVADLRLIAPALAALPGHRAG